MKTTIIIGHPYSKSFNHAVLDKVLESVDATVINLIEDGFNPSMLVGDLAGFSKGQAADPLVEKYQTILKNTEQLIFIFPIWWYGLPAIYKGFLDKVMLKGFAYEEKNGLLVGQLTHIRKTILITTADSPKWYITLLGGNPIGALKKRVFKDIGLKNVKWLHQGYVAKTTPEKRGNFLDIIAAAVK